MAILWRAIIGLALVSLLLPNALASKNIVPAGQGSVTYDGRSLIINGKRELLFSGSIHYTRSTPDMWPELIKKAKAAGLNCIQTYVFWNVHEPLEGRYDFEANYDLVKFVKLIAEHEMYAILRVGPFIQAEWNQGGLPYWLREFPNITFRTNDDVFKHHMQKFVTLIINKMKDEKLFVPQGGPIVLAQIENEFDTIQYAYRANGIKYIKWAGNMALSLDTKVPWIMCKQPNAPGPVINTCNGRHCADTFPGPNSPNKPALWTENWTAQFRTWGDPPSQRSAEDIAFAVARWFAKNGTMNNYYMFHGGTNFGRSSSSFVTTRYYDEAPLDEFGLERGPKYYHCRDVHSALRLARKALLWGTSTETKVDADREIIVWENKATKVCAAFLTNNNTEVPKIIEFRGEEYYLPPRSISVLPDCKTVVYNTQTIVGQHNARNFISSEVANKKLSKWEMSKEVIPEYSDKLEIDQQPRELYAMTKDTTDYAWYATSINLTPYDLPMRENAFPVLRVASLGHAMHAFVNGEYVGSAHGGHVTKSFVFQRPIKLKAGSNKITFLGVLTGLPDSGAYMNKRWAGPRFISILGLNTGTLELSQNSWGHQVGLEGEKLRVYTQGGSHRVKWEKAEPGKSLTWYKAYFDAPEGNNPVVLNLTTMGKGMAWVNGKCIGRYWQSFISPLMRASQEEYHIPRTWIKPTDNLLVLLEEEGGDPEKIDIMTVNRDTICSYMTEFHPPNVKSWGRRDGKIKAVVDEVKAKAQLTCPDSKTIVEIEFASFGNPSGACGSFTEGSCSFPVARQIVEQSCLGKNACEVPVKPEIFVKGKDTCLYTAKTLAIQVKCAHKD